MAADGVKSSPFVATFPGADMTQPKMAPSFLALAAVMLLQSCGTTPVKQLLDDPSQYEGKTVRVAGSVKGAVGVLGMGAYQIDDGSGTITVVSEGGGAPRNGAEIGVEGTFRSAFTVGTQTLAVILEKKRAQR